MYITLYSNTAVFRIPNGFQTRYRYRYNKYDSKTILVNYYIECDPFDQTPTGHVLFVSIIILIRLTLSTKWMNTRNRKKYICI